MNAYENIGMPMVLVHSPPFAQTILSTPFVNMPYAIYSICQLHRYVDMFYIDKHISLKIQSFAASETVSKIF